MGSWVVKSSWVVLGLVVVTYSEAVDAVGKEQTHRAVYINTSDPLSPHMQKNTPLLNRAFVNVLQGLDWIDFPLLRISIKEGFLPTGLPRLVFKDSIFL